MASKQQLITNAGNTEFWKQVQKEISNCVYPCFICPYSITFKKNWSTHANFRQEVGYLANKFLAEYISTYEITVNDITETDAQLFTVINTTDTPISILVLAKIRTDFILWAINYTSIYPN